MFFADFSENSLNIFAEIYKFTYKFSGTEFETCECSGFFIVIPGGFGSQENQREIQY